MKHKKPVNQLIKIFSFVVFMTGCEYVPPDPPPVINQPPVITGLTDLNLPLNFGTHEIDFANYVSDQEGEIITYTVSNSNDTVISISLTGSVLTITEVGTGPSVIDLTATDGREGHEVDTSFTVTVKGIWGAEDYTGSVLPGFLDFNGYGEGHIYENPIPGLKVEGWDYDWESPQPKVKMANNDHLLITNDVAREWYWMEYRLDDTYDFTGKKIRFDYSYFTAPPLSGTHWEEDADLAAADIRLWFVSGGWDTGGAIYFSSLNLEYSTEWQEVEIPLAEFGTLWELPVDLSQIKYCGMEIWGGTSSDPISFRLDNFGFVE